MIKVFKLLLGIMIKKQDVKLNINDTEQVDIYIPRHFHIDRHTNKK